MDTDIKVVIAANLPGDMPIGGESVWAAFESAGRYRIANVPYYSSMVSYDDVISVKKDEHDVWVVDAIIEPSAYSTFRAHAFAGAERAVALAAFIKKESGATVEGWQGTERLAIAVLPEGVISVLNILENLQQRGQGEYFELACRHDIPVDMVRSIVAKRLALKGFVRVDE